MEERKSARAKFNLISCDFKQSLKIHNESPSLDRLEFRSHEPNSFKLNASAHAAIKENSYSDVIKAFIQKFQERNVVKSRDENYSPKIASSTPLRKISLRNSFNISGISHLDTTIRKKIDCSHNKGVGGFSLNDSDFESMDQDQYDDDDTKENVNINDYCVYEKIKCIQLNSASKDKKLRGSSEKFKRHLSPHKSGRKSCKSAKLIKVTRENSHAYLKSENTSLASIITTASINEIEKYPLKTSQSTINSEITDLDIKNESLDFAFTHPNKTQSFEASIKNLTQLSVSIYSRFLLRHFALLNFLAVT